MTVFPVFRSLTLCLATSCVLPMFAQTNSETNVLDSIKHLDEVTVEARRKGAMRAVRLSTPLHLTPMSVTTLPRSIWENRGISHIQDAIKFLPGAHMRTLYGAYQRLEVRGFDVTPMLIDGVRDERYVPPGSSAPFADFASVETIELLKGPASVLHGQFAAGGVLNVVRKAPSRKRILDLTLRYGSYDHRQASIDLGGAITSKLSYRAVGNTITSEGFRRTNDKRLSTYLALGYEISPVQKLELRTAYFNDRYGADAGLPPVMSHDIYKVSDNQIYLNKGELLPGLDPRARYDSESDRFTNKGANASLQYSNALSRYLQINEYLTYSYDEIDYFATEALSYRVSDNPIYPHYYKNGDNKKYIDLAKVELSAPLKFGNRAHQINNQLELSGKLDLGQVRSEWLLGYTLVSYKRDGYSSTRAPRTNPLDESYGVYGPGLYSLVDVYSPRSQGYIRNDKHTTAYPSLMTSHSVYLQTMLEPVSRFKLMLAGRWDYVRFERTTKNDPVSDGRWKFTASPYDYSIANNALTYRIGLLYNPLDELSVYGSVANFFQPLRNTVSDNTIYVNTLGQTYDPRTSRESFKPMTGYQTELGVKYAKGWLRGSLAGFYIKREHELKSLGRSTEASPRNVMGQVGTTVSKGVEVEVQATPINDLMLSLGYTYTDAKVSGIASNEFLKVDPQEGVQQPHVPLNMFVLSGSYNFSSLFKGLSANTSLSYTDKMINNLNQDVVFPSHFLLDLGLGYQFKGGISLGVQLNNLLDEQYGINTLGRQINPSIGRNYTVSFSYRLGH